MEACRVRVSLWGLLAYAFLYASVVGGAGLSSKTLRARVPAAARAGRLHEVLSLAALFAAFVHAAVSVLSPQGLHWRWLVFAGTEDGVAPGVAAGVASLYACGAAAAAFYLRRALGPAAWRAVHALSYPAFTLAVWHSLALGANAWLPALRTVYAATAGSAAALAVLRGLEQLPGPVGKPAGGV
jgi:DMSO/TMAO reductase YedYZ heme-binding membrane subunit